jgi:uncharacterized delta-60 repeat protein
MGNVLKRTCVVAVGIILLLPFFLSTSVWAGDGDLDSSFGVGGIVKTGFGDGNGGFGRAVTIDSQDRIIAVGDNDTQQQFAVVRYSPNGSLDSSFGQGGKVVTDVGPSADIANAVKIDSLGRIVVAGITDPASGGPSCCQYHFFMARYLSDGSLDSSFGGGTGKVITNIIEFNSSLVGMAIDESDNILLVGSISASTPAFGISDFLVMRFTSSGDFDATFGTEGMATVDFENGLSYPGNAGDVGYAIAIDDQGRILVTGANCMGPTNSCNFATARLTTAGALDTSFGTGGKVVTDFAQQNDYARGVGIDSNGKIVVGGDGADTNPNLSAVVRYNQDGSVDTSFGDAGKAYVELNNEGYPHQSVVDSQDRIVVAGFSSQGFNAVRFQANGTVDSTFGHNGVATVSAGSAHYMLATAVDRYDRVLLVGASIDSSSSFWQFTTVRFGAPSVDSLSWATNPLASGQNTTLTIFASNTRSTVTNAEYFIGNDPGLGNGTPMTQQSGGQWSATFGASLSPDIYTVGVRVRDALGSWSPVAFDSLVVYDPAGPTNLVGKQDFVPSLNGGDVLPGLDSDTQTDKANFAFDVHFTSAGSVDPASEFSFCYDLSSKKCKKLQNNPFLLTATSFNWLSISGTNSSNGAWQGTGTMLLDGNTSTVVFRVQIIDGNRLTPTVSDKFVLKIYPNGSDPAVASPLYQVSVSLPANNNVKIH